MYYYMIKKKRMNKIGGEKFMVNVKDWNGLNFRKLKEHSKELEEFDGRIPLALYDHINISNRLDYLDSINQKYEYDDMEEYRKTFDVDKDIEEIIKFVNENPVFEDIIKIKK